MIFVSMQKKRHKTATVRLLDVLVTQHAKWTARRIRRALFGQSLVDFSGSSWTCVKIHKSSAPVPACVNRRKASVSRMTQEFSQAERQLAGNSQACVPKMSQYGDSQDIFSDNHDIFSDNHDVYMDVGTEDSQEAGQESPAISQRCVISELSPR